MTEDQIREAIVQVKVTCELAMQNYELLSLRGALYTCGYDSDDADKVILYCAERGFTNCIDPIVPVKSYPDFKPEYPSADVCHWGPDQLESRLSFIL